MKDYKNNYDKLYNLKGINYSGFNISLDSIWKLDVKYNQALSYLNGIQNHTALEILEVGASLGHASRIFPKYTGVEYSQSAVDIGKSIYGENLNLIQSDARKLPFVDNSMDFVISINT